MPDQRSVRNIRNMPGMRCLPTAKKFLSPAERGQMACVELVSKLKTEGATPAPRATHLQEMKPRFTRPGLFLWRRTAANIAELPELQSGRNTRCETLGAMALAIALAAHYFRCHDFFL